MNPNYSNPPEPSPADAGDAASAPAPGSGLAAALSPLQASLEQTDFGWTLRLSPMRAAQALASWPALHDEPQARTLLHDVTESAWRDDDGPSSLDVIARALGLGDTVDRFEEDQFVLEDTPLIDLVAVYEPRGLRAVRVDGPIEQRDARAMANAAAHGLTPLDVEFRAVAAWEIENDRSVVLHVRERDDALAVLAEAFRGYLATVWRRPESECTAPEAWMLERLLGVTGTITVRPIETDVLSTFIDVGVSTDRLGEPRPADRSLIFDIPSRTWHDED